MKKAKIQVLELRQFREVRDELSNTVSANAVVRKIQVLELRQFPEV